jgi:UDP-glucose 4-epimerase
LIGEPKTPKVSEDHTATPKTAYGISKLASEHYLRLYNELNNLNYVIFRFFNIYGPYQKNGLIPSLYSRISQNLPLTVFGKGDQIRDYVFIKDIIPFFEKAITENIADNKIFNMGTGNGTSILDVIDILSKTMNIKPEIEFKDPRPGEIGNFVADTKLLSSTFGNIPSTTAEEGIKQTAEWLKNN